jgi:Na+/H+ antiporter NhaD/arsenite permease-like protein
MATIVILTFIIGYLAIVFEHPIKIDKTPTALIMGALCWAFLALGFKNGSVDVIDTHDHLLSATGGITETLEESFNQNLLHHIGTIAEILVFLIGAMTIVEIIDTHRGFEVLKGMVNTKSKKRLLWITGIIGFVLSSIIDNLTATIVLITLLRKLVKNPVERMWYSSLVITATNAGGAWSPIGDVTTTMLWIGKKVTSQGLMEWMILPSLTCFIVPYSIASYLSIFKGNIDFDTNDTNVKVYKSSSPVLWLGLGAIVFVPLFKTLFHLPPYIGMMISLAIVWIVSEWINPEAEEIEPSKNDFKVHSAISRIEHGSILFFLGILLAVAALESLSINGLGSLRYGAESMSKAIPSTDLVVMLLGVLSAVIDNVPLVAASMGMFADGIDAKVWHFIAYSAGTGGSMLIIGSAAGVAAMGMEKINFIWYLKNITWLAAAGFIAGCAVFLLQYSIFH